MFGDYYYVLAADETDTKRPASAMRSSSAVLYLTYQSDIATDFAIRFRLEAKDAGFAQGSKMEPFVKHGYLQWKEGIGECGYIPRAFGDADLGGCRKGLGLPIGSQDRARLE